MGVQDNTAEVFTVNEKFSKKLGEIWVVTSGDMPEDQLHSRYQLQLIYEVIDDAGTAVVNNMDITGLIANLEDKIDNMEIQFSNSLNSIAESLIKLVDLQSNFIKETVLIKQEISSLLHQLNETVTRL